MALPSAPPRLVTDRLVLRALVPDDVDAIHGYARRAEVSRFLTWPPHESLEDTRAFFRRAAEEGPRRGRLTWAIARRDDEHRLIGTATLDTRPDPDLFAHQDPIPLIGYVLDPDHTGLGYATEAVRAVVRWAFDAMGLGILGARCDPKNKGSRRVLEKNGFAPDGFTPKAAERAPSEEVVLYVRRRDADANR